MKELKVRDLMTADPTTLKRNDTLTLADDIMRLGRIRHLPVVDDDGQLVGIVSQRDLFRDALAQALGYGRHAHREILDTLSVKKVMTSDLLLTTRPDTSLVEAAIVMRERKIGCLPVVENGRLIGILTEGDFVALIARGGL
jgi:CBS domain-containing protein